MGELARKKSLRQRFEEFLDELDDDDEDEDDEPRRSRKTSARAGAARRDDDDDVIVLRGASARRFLMLEAEGKTADDKGEGKTGDDEKKPPAEQTPQRTHSRYFADKPKGDEKKTDDGKAKE